MPVELGRQQPAWPSAVAGLAVAWSRWARRGPAGRGGGAGTLCFTGKEFGRACRAGWDDPGWMEWGFAAEWHGLSRLPADPCVWGIFGSPGRARRYLGWPVPLMLSPLLQRVLITQRRGYNSSRRGFPPPRL